MKIILTSLICISLSFTLIAQERYPIDQLANNKLQEAFSNADMINAENTAHEQWDHLLNIVYKEVENQMQPGTFMAIRESQRAWLSYRDAEFKVIERLYYAELQGTMWYAPAAAARKKVVRQRVISLLDQLGLLTMQFEEEAPGITGKWISTEPDNKTSILEVREDFTMVWTDQSTDKYEVEFYRMSNECSELTVQQGEKIISLIAPGNPSASHCYHLEFTDSQLTLKSLDNNASSLTFKRLN